MTDELDNYFKQFLPKTDVSPYDEHIIGAAAEYELDPDLLRSMMHEESRGKPRARSNKGASGLMQLMPGTARNLGVKNIYDPKENIYGGAKYARQLLDMFNGDVDLALAGYNAGEGAVQKYGNKIPPYNETRKYVKNIRGKYTGNGYAPNRQNNALDQYFSQFKETATVPDESDAVDSYFNQFKGVDTAPDYATFRAETGLPDTPDSQALFGGTSPTFQTPQAPQKPTLPTDDLTISMDNGGQLVKPQAQQRPSTESPMTLEAQRKAVHDKASSRIGLLYTDARVAPPIDDKLEYDISLKDGQLLRVSKDKFAKWNATTGVTTTDLQNGADFTPIIGGKAQNINEPSEFAVVTKDAQGNELVASAVTDYASIPEEARLQAKQFPNQPINTQVVPSAVVDAQRKASALNGVDPAKMFGGNVKVGKGVETPQMPTTPVNEADYQQWREYMKLDDDATSRQQFQMALATAPNGSVDVSATVNQPEIEQGVDKQSTSQTKGKYTDDTFDIPISNKRGSYKSSYYEEVASRLSSQLDVPYDVALNVVKAQPIQYRSNGQTVGDDEEYLSALAKEGLTPQVTIGGGLKRKIIEAAKQNAEREAKIKAKLEEYTNELKPDEPSSLAGIRTRFDLGLMTPDEFLAAVKREKDLAARITAENDTGAPLDLRNIGQARIGNEVEVGKKYTQPTFNADVIKAILKDYDSLDSYAKEQERLKKEYKYRPLAFPVEFAKNFGAALPKAVASLLKTGDILANISPAKIGYNLANGNDAFKLDETVLTDLGDRINKYVESVRNKDLKESQLVTLVPDTLGQVGVQMAAAALTGGASLPTAIGASMGAAGAYDEARKFKDATDRQKILAAAIGAVAAVPDALLFSKMTGGQLAEFVANTGKSLAAKFGIKFSKEIGDEAAKVGMAQLVNKIMTNGLFEGPQEVLENKINDAYALVSYDPSETRKTKLLSFNDEDKASFIGGILGGGASGAVEAKLEKMNANEREQTLADVAQQLADMVTSKEITAKQYEEASNALENRKAYFAKDAKIQAGKAQKATGKESLQVETPIKDETKAEISAQPAQVDTEVVVSDKGDKGEDVEAVAVEDTPARKPLTRVAKQGDKVYDGVEFDEPSTQAEDVKGQNIDTSSKTRKEGINDIRTGNTRTTENARDRIGKNTSILSETDSSARTGGEPVDTISLTTKGGQSILALDRKLRSSEKSQLVRDFEKVYGAYQNYHKYRDSNPIASNTAFNVFDRALESFEQRWEGENNPFADKMPLRDIYKYLLDPSSGMPSNSSDARLGEKFGTVVPNTTNADATSPIQTGIKPTPVNSSTPLTHADRPAVEVEQKGKRVKIRYTDDKGGTAIVREGDVERDEVAKNVPDDSDVSPLGFYSQVARTIEQKMPNRASAEQVRGLLKDAKQEELDWLDIDSFLADNPRPTKQEVLDYVRMNNADVREVIRGENKATWNGDDLIAADGERVATIIDNGDGTFGYESDMSDGIQTFSTRAEAQREAETETVDAYYSEHPRTDTKFSQYTLPGGENYRELLLTLPTQEMSRDLRQLPNGNWAWFVNDKQIGSPYPTKSDAELGVLGSIKEFEKLKKAQTAQQYKSNHWNERNVLAHVRFDERDGGKTLHIAEIQSDWHQEGRKKGYQGDLATERELENLEARGIDDSGQGRGFAIYTKDGNFVTNVIKEGGLTADEALQIARHRLAGQRRGSIADKFTQGVPDAPFKKSWPMLTFKRILKYAVDNGYERITIDTGETNAERYDLSKQVERVTAKKTSDGIAVNVTPNNARGSNDLIRKTLSPSELPDFIGKDLADKIIADTDNSSDWQTYTGLDLKVGGEGMKRFYDQILPADINKYLKRFDGKVERGTVETGQANKGSIAVSKADTGYNVEVYDANGNLDQAKSLWSAERLRNYAGDNLFAKIEKRTQDGFVENFNLTPDDSSPNTAPVHSITITPKMRAITEQPMFRLPDELAEFRADIENARTIPMAKLLGEVDVARDYENLGDGIFAPKTIEAYELLRRIMATYEKQGGVAVDTKATSFDGAYLDAKQTADYIKVINDSIAKAEKASVDPTSLKSLAKLINEAADERGIIFLWNDAALAEEKTHRVIAEIRAANRASQVGQDVIDAITDSDVFKNALNGRFGRGYGKANKATQVEEFAVKAALGQYDEIGVTDANKREATALAVDFFESLVETNADKGKYTREEIINRLSAEIAYATETISEQTARQSKTDTGNANETSESNDGSERQEPDAGRKDRQDTGDAARVERPDKFDGVTGKPLGKPSKVGRSIEANAIEQALTEGFEGTAEYDPLTFKEQAEKVAKLIADDLPKARRIMNGQERVPSGMRSSALLIGLEQHAETTGDVELLRDLAKSPLVTETSIAAQELGLLRQRNPTSPVQMIQEVEKAREKASKRRTRKTTEDVVNDIKKEAKPPKPRDWASFLETLKC